MTLSTPIPARFFETVDELRAWFVAHHADTPELWVGFYKAHSGRRGVVYPEAVDEALCFGWIDTTVRRIDDERYANRFTPRRPQSDWSVTNRRRFAELNKAGRVHEAGRRAFGRRLQENRRPSPNDHPFRLSPSFAARLRTNPAADGYFRSRPASYRKRATFWVMSAVRPETRERRWEALLRASASSTIPRALLLPGEEAPRPRRARGKRAKRSRHRQSGSGRR